MDNEKIDKLNQLQLDLLKEIGNIGSGNAATALANMLHEKVQIKVPKVQILEFKNVADVLGGEETPVASILFNVTGDVTGMIMFVVNTNSAKNLISLLLSNDDKKDSEFTEIQLSALKEIGNILTGAYLASISNLTNMNLTTSIPYLSIDMAGAILSVPAIEFGKIGDKVLFIQTDFGKDIEHIEGYFIFVPEIESLNKIIKTLGVA